MTFIHWSGHPTIVALTRRRQTVTKVRLKTWTTQPDHQYYVKEDPKRNLAYAGLQEHQSHHEENVVAPAPLMAPFKLCVLSAVVFCVIGAPKSVKCPADVDDGSAYIIVGQR